MKKYSKLVFLILLSFILMSCGKDKENRALRLEIESLQNTVQMLEETLDQRREAYDLLMMQHKHFLLFDQYLNKYSNQKILDNQRYERENFRQISLMTSEFTSSRSDGDYDKLLTLVSRNISVYYKDDDIRAKLLKDNIDLPLYFSNRNNKINMHIIYFSANKDNQSFKIISEEHSENERGEYTGIGFIHLFFIMEEGHWKIDDIEYDI